MPKIKQLDPLNIRQVAEWVAQTSRFRMLVLMPDKRTRTGKLYAYSLTGPDVELEHDVRRQSGQIVGTYTKAADPALLMADIAAAMAEI